MATCKERQHPLLELPREQLALCWRTLGSERHRYAIAAWPDKLGTDPMADGGAITKKQMDAGAEIEKNPVTKRQVF